MRQDSMRRDGVRDFGDDRSGAARESSSLASCFWCERRHEAQHPLSVCPACAATLSTMRSLEMTGSYELDDEAIDRVLTRASPGNYALGYMDGEDFSVFYVGRSDTDVRRRLHEWVGMPSRYERYAPASRAAWASRRGGPLPLGLPAAGRVGIAVDSSYTRFAYSYAASAEAAFEKECRNYEDFGGSRILDNEVPPARTPGSARSSSENGLESLGRRFGRSSLQSPGGTTDANGSRGSALAQSSQTG